MAYMRYRHFRYARPPADLQRRAASIVGMARRKGELVPQPCQVCGSDRHIEAHHDDYSRPLDIVWLCARHHVRFHWARRKGSTLTAAHFYGIDGAPPAAPDAEAA